MILVYGGLFLLFIIQPNTKQKLTSKKTFCILSGIFLFLIAASRDLAMGDLLGYKNSYIKMLPNTSYLQLWEDWRSDNLKDFGFYAVAKFFSDIGLSATFWLLLIAAFFAVMCALFLYKFSKQPYIGLVAVLSLFYSFTFTGIRQTVALAIVFLSLRFISEKKLIPFILSVLVASLFHSTAIIMLPAYFIAKLKIGLKQPIMVAVSFSISIFAPQIFRNLITFFSWDDAYSGYAEREETLSWAGFIIQLAIWLFCLYLRRSIKEDKRYMYTFIDSLINCLTIGLCFQCFATVVAEAFRLSYYYSICLIAVVPNVIDKQTYIRKDWLQLIISCVFIVYMLRAGMYFNIGWF